ncbi:MAG: hypothetical protein KDD62_02290 [Bdellovibrionales bacterium]|nr:hypothetical protein [Bdellovibrionales bacterium]
MAESKTSTEAGMAENVAIELDGSLPQCREVVKSCFVSSDDEKSKCFFSASKHPFCEGSELGSLVFKRWAMVPHKIEGIQAPPALLGPQLVDKTCIGEFEDKLSATLQQNDIPTDSMNSLNTFLDSCSREVSDRLARP